MKHKADWIEVGIKFGCAAWSIQCIHICIYTYTHIIWHIILLKTLTVTWSETRLKQHQQFKQNTADIPDCTSVCVTVKPKLMTAGKSLRVCVCLCVSVLCGKLMTKQQKMTAEFMKINLIKKTGRKERDYWGNLDKSAMWRHREGGASTEKSDERGRKKK